MKKVTTEDTDVDIDLAHLARAVWSRKFTVLLTGAAFAGAAFGIATVVPPSYKSETRILIEGRESSYTRSEAAASGDGDRLSPESVESQVSIMSSAEIIGNIADRFNLGRLTEFSPNASLLDRIITRVRPEVDSPQGEVIEKVREHLKVYRVDQTRVIVIEFSTSDPQLARDVPNAIADEYLARQKGALLSSNTNATGWLEGEIKDLREAVRSAEAKVADYRAKSNLLVGQNQNVLSTQQLSEISTELSRTRAARAAAEGRAKSISEAFGKGRALDTVAEVLNSPTVQALREREVALRADIADLSTTLLENHPRLRALRSQLRDLDTEIAREAQKVKSSLETEADSARQREVALNAEMERLKKDAAQSGSQEVELRSLEREAQSQSQLLESYLTRYREAVARGAKDYLPVDARIFSQAQLPAEPYFPKVMPITAAAGISGLVIASLCVLIGELFSGRALSPTGGRRRLDAEPEVVEPAAPVVALAPFFAAKPAIAAVETAPVVVASTEGRVEPEAKPIESDASQSPPQKAVVAPPAQRPSTAGSVSELARAIAGSGVRQVLVASSDAPGENPGSTILARRLADLGHATILVDLSDRQIAAGAMGVDRSQRSIGDVIEGEASLAEIIHRDRTSAAHVVSGFGISSDEAETSAFLGALAQVYERVVVECGSLSGTVLARIMNDDAALLVGSSGDGRSAQAAVERLSREGIEDVVIMLDDTTEQTHRARAA